MSRAGRGYGKTRLAAEDIAHYALSNPSTRCAVVAATSNDLRKVCFEGDSGLIKSIPPICIKQYNKSLQSIELYNGSLIEGFSAEKPDRLRGPQFHRAWCDELASWVRPEAFDMLMFCLRLGDKPQCIITTTPRPTKIIKEIVARKDAIIFSGSTFDNKANLAPAYIKAIKDKYEGTRLGRQELYGLILDDNPGALWTRDLIDETRITKCPELSRIVVAVDPATTSNPDSDETGIIVGGINRMNDKVHGYVLEDASLIGSPDTWARKAVQMYHYYKADRIIAEVNNGGDMVETIIRSIDPNVPYKKVHASKGKQIRAEPIAALYEQKRIHHVGMFGALEDQLCEWDPTVSNDSPDRLDAAVWAFTELMTENQYDGFMQYYQSLTNN